MKRFSAHLSANPVENRQSFFKKRRIFAFSACRANSRTREPLAESRPGSTIAL
jgi:hypothetical protein